MIARELKNEINEAAQDKLRSIIEDAIEKKLKREAKKIVRKLTFRFIVTGAAMVGTTLLIKNLDVGSIVEKITDKKS